VSFVFQEVRRTSPWDTFVGAYKSSIGDQADKLMRAMWKGDCAWRRYAAPTDGTGGMVATPSLWFPPFSVSALRLVSAEAAADARDARATRSGHVGCEVAVLALQELHSIVDTGGRWAEWWIEHLRHTWVQHFDVHMLLTTSIWKRFWRHGGAQATPALAPVAMQVRIAHVHGPQTPHARPVTCMRHMYGRYTARVRLIRTRGGGAVHGTLGGDGRPTGDATGPRVSIGRHAMAAPRRCCGAQVGHEGGESRARALPVEI
jgi:hypothetical protein